MADHVEYMSTHLFHKESGVGDNGERAIKLLMKAHEPEGVEGVYIREAPAVEATRHDARQPGLQVKGALVAMQKRRTYQWELY